MHDATGRLRVVSDLHLEFCQHRAQVEAVLSRALRPGPTASACVLAGDIAVPTGSRRRWLDLAQYPKVTLLEPGVIGRWGDHRVVGATLWFREARDSYRFASMLSDFAAISGFVPWVYEQNRDHVRWLDEVVREGDIVVTHHLPTARSVAPKYEGDQLNAFFVCAMDALIEERRPALWVHAHTHESLRYALGATTIFCNPLGYPGEENPAFDDGYWSP